MLIKQRQNHNLKPQYHTSQQEIAIFKKALLFVLVLALQTSKKFSKKYLDKHSRGKSDKNDIFDVTSCSIF